MKILVVKVPNDPMWEDIENAPEPMKEIVGDEIEAIPTLVKGVLLVVDEKAIFKHKPLNFTTEKGYIAGDVFFVGQDRAEFIDLTREQAEQIMKTYFPKTPCPPMPCATRRM